MPNGKHPLTVDDLRVHTREIISFIQESQVRQDNWVREEFIVVNTKLDAIMSGEVLVTRKQFQRLLRVLANKGISLNEAEILAA